MFLYNNLGEYLEGEQQRLEKLLSSNIPEQGIISQVLAPAENQDKKSNLAGYAVTREADSIVVDYLGIQGDRHRNASRPRTGREKALYPEGTIIRGHRHIFAVSLYDCDILSERVGVKITPALLGANIVISRDDNEPYSLSELPPETHLIIGSIGATEMPKPPIATLKRYVQQQGCGTTGYAIAEHYGERSLVKKFTDESKDHRGIVFSVEYPVEIPAILEPGQSVFFKFPNGRAP